MSQKPTLQKVQSRRKVAEPRPPGFPHAAAVAAPGGDAPKNYVQAGRAKVLAERGSRAAIIAQVGGDALAHEISLLEGENFNPETYVTTKCQTMTEANVRKLCTELSDYKRLSADQMKKTVYDNYKSFIRSSKEISDLEGELRSIHSLLTAQAHVLRTLVERPSVVAATASDKTDDGLLDAEGDAAANLRRDRGLLEIPEQMIVCLAERNFPKALQLLEQGEGELLVIRTRMRSGAVQLVGAPTVEELESLDEQLQERRADLLKLLADLTTQPSVTRQELKQAVSAIAALGDAKRAHTLLLDAHTARMHTMVSALRPIGTSYSVSYTSQISRLIFSTVLQATDDSATVFGDALDFSSELVLWAHAQTEWCSMLLQRYVLSAAASSGGLRLAAECVQIAVVHCSLLEERGLALAPVLLRLVRPSVEEALDANIRRIEDSVGAMVAADNWAVHVVSTSNKGHRVTTLGASSLSASGSSGSLATAGASLRMTSSAFRLLSMVQDFLEDVVPIVNMQLTTPALDGLHHLFKQYVAMMSKARAPPEDAEGWSDTTALNAELISAASRAKMEGEGSEGATPRDPSAGGGPHVRRATSEAQQLALIANATVLSEELPRLAVKLTQPAGAEKEKSRLHREHRRSSGGETKRQQMQQWKKGLLEEVDTFRMGFCLQRAMKLLYPDAEQEGALLPNLYFYLDHEGVPPAAHSALGGDGMPTQTLQDFLRAVLMIQESASEVLVGRDRLVLSLLTQFGLALLTLVCHDRAWEDEPCFVGPIGLQKFLLDITFLKEVAIRYHFSSRRLQQEADNSMARAREVFDPDRLCPEDQVFREAAQMAMAQLLSDDRGRANRNRQPPGNDA